MLRRAQELSLYICIMKAVKKYSGGGIADDRGTIRREMDRQKKSKRIKELEGMIKSVKGTASAKPLVREYRALTGVKWSSVYLPNTPNHEMLLQDESKEK